MNNEQDHDMDLSDESLVGSRNPTYAMPDDLFTKEETEWILKKAMPKDKELDYNWMQIERSTHHEWNNFEEADKLTKKMNASLSFWYKVNEEKKYQETVTSNTAKSLNQQTAASNTGKSLKRPRSSEDGRETDQDPFINEVETRVNDDKTRVDDISDPRPPSKRRVHW